MPRIAIYCRVSTREQNCKRQRDELLAYCEKNNFQVIKIFEEIVSTRKRSREVREDVIRLAKNRECDAILVWELSRWSRSVSDLIETLQKLQACNVSLLTFSGMEMDLATSQGKLIASLLGAIAEFERDLIRERVKSGLEAAKARGVRLGRAKGLTSRVKRLKDKVLLLRKEGRSFSWIAKDLQISKRTIQKIVNMEREASH